MTAPRLRLIVGLTSTLALAATLGAVPVPAQGPGRAPKRVAPSLAGVLPQLNAIVQVRADDGTNLAAVRVSADRALAYVPRRGSLPAGYEARIENTWTRVADVALDPVPRLVLVRVPMGSAESPRLTARPLPASAGFIVGAAGREGDLDIQTVWLEPGGPIELPPGAVVFDAEGGFLGLVTERGAQRAIMPAADVLTAAASMVKR